MSCISINLRRADQPIKVVSRRKGKPVHFAGVRYDLPARIGVRYDLPARIGVERTGEPLEFRCGIVCSITDKFYLKVPQEQIWLLPENDWSQDVVVYANVTWRIE